MEKKVSKGATDRISFAICIFSAAAIFFSYGVAVGKYKVFPYQIISLAEKGWGEFKTQMLRFGGAPKKSLQLPWYYKTVNQPHSEAVIREIGLACDGPRLVTRIGRHLELRAEIIDVGGRVLHEWDIDWFKLWPDPVHLTTDVIPKSKPGTFIHGAVVMENGDLIFNFSHLGLVRINRKSEIKWRLPYRTHHSIHRHDDGNLWLCGQLRRSKPNPKFPNRKPPFDEYTILEVAPQGDILQEWSVPDILYKNGLSGLLTFWLYAESSPNKLRLDDRLHLNDVEPFPNKMEEGFFGKGDILVSLRNINTVFVFNRHTEKIKYCATGLFIHQHDPDFIDGNRFSVFDNKNISENGNLNSRIIIVNAAENSTDLFYEGNKQNPFYSDILGKHQWLPNGNLLITESTQGRGFEINRRGEVVWGYINYVYKGVVGVVTEVQRLPPAQTFAPGNTP